MPHYHQPGPAPKGSAMQDYNTPTTATLTSPSQRNIKSQLDGRADYRSQLVPFVTRDEYGQPSSQFQQQQQWRQQQTQHSQMQGRPARQGHPFSLPAVTSERQKPTASSAVTTLLPYCTVDVPLNKSQVIAVTDIAGSLRELVLLALGAKDGDEECMSRLEGALGSEQAMTGVIDFFSDEFEIE